MKKEKCIILALSIIIITLICFIYTLINENKLINNNKMIIKEMTQSTLEADLNNQINALNAEHTEYMNYVQTCKATIASAISDTGVTTSDSDTIDTMASNIRSLSGRSTIESIASSKSSNSAQSIDCTSLPNYENLTASSFIIDVVAFKSYSDNDSSWNNWAGLNYDVNNTYDATTGILKVQAMYTKSSNDKRRSYFLYDVYVIY